MAKGVKSTHSKDLVLTALKKHNGVVKYASADLKISPDSLRTLVKRHNLQTELDDLRFSFSELLCDTAENVILTVLNNHAKDPKSALSAAYFVLNNQGRRRGYSWSKNQEEVTVDPSVKEMHKHLLTKLDELRDIKV